MSVLWLKKEVIMRFSYATDCQIQSMGLQ